MKKKKKKEVEKEDSKRNKNVADQKAATRNKKIEYTEEIDKNEEETYTEEIKQNKRRKYTKEEIKRKKKRIKNIFKIILFALILIAIGTFLCTSSIFKIQEIKIIGNEQVMLEEIQIDNRKGKNIFLLSKTKIERELKKNPYIKKVTTKKILPNKIEVQIEERQKDYMIQSENGYFYLDKQGYILEELSVNIAKPILLGYATTELQPGKRLNEEDLKKLEDVIKIVENCKKIKIYDIITNINISDENEYIIYIEEKRKMIYIGDSSNLANKMLYIEDILEKEEGREGKIFVNGSFVEGFQAYFREEVNQ